LGLKPLEHLSELDWLPLPPWLLWMTETIVACFGGIF